MMKAFCSLIVSLLAVGYCQQIAAGDFQLKADGKQIVISSGGQKLASFVYQDEEITRPYFAHVKTLQGTQVTRNHPPLPDDPQDHATFHPGIFLAFGDISGNDYWRLKAKVRSELVEVELEDDAFRFQNRYLAASDNKTVVCVETCRYRFIKLENGYLLVSRSSFRSEQSDFYFGDQEEMGLGVRVASPLREKGGNGRILNSEGQISAKQTWGQPAKWCDYSGTIEGNQVGVMIMAAPNNLRPSWWHNRDYGLFVANLFGRKAMGQGDTSKLVVKKGETFLLKYGVYIHESAELSEQQLADAYEAYLKILQERR